MKKLIFDIIEKHSPIKRKKLLAELQHGHYSMFHKMTDRRLREFISQMRHEGKKIGSSEQGYFIIRSRPQAVEARDYMMKPVRERVIIAHLMLKNWGNGKGGNPAQLAIEEFLQKT